MVVLATGGMNLSVGSIGVCAVMMSGYLMQTLGLPVAVALAGALALGAALGWLNGFAIMRTGVNSFIMTLASANLFSGAMLILTKAVPLNALPPAVGAFGKLKIAGVRVAAAADRHGASCASCSCSIATPASADASWRPAPTPRAAEMSGVPVGRVVIISHVAVGRCSPRSPA